MRCTARVLIVVSLAMAMAVGCGGGGLPTVSPSPGTALLSPSPTATETPPPSFTAGASATGTPASATPLATPAEETAPPTPSPTEPPTAPPTEAPTPAPASVNATVAFHSYDAATGLVTFRIVNGDDGATLESARARIVNRVHGDTYYHAYSNEPFRPSPTSDTRADSLAPGTTAYLRYELAGHPAGQPCQATITLHTAEGLTGASATRTVDFDLPAPTAIDATVTYHSYDAATGWVTFRVVNNAAGATLESARAQITNLDTNSWTISNDPFRPTPASDDRVDSLAPGATAYLRYELAGHPTGVPCRATITLYTGEGSSGISSVKTVDFALPAPAAINATVTYHSYDAATGMVTFRIVNTGGVAIESVRARIINRDTSAEYYHAYSNEPFRANPTTSTRVDSLAPGATAYLRYELAGHPTGVPCRATITIYAGEGLTGASSAKTMNFALPAPAAIAAMVTYHSYDAATGVVTLRIINFADGVTLESVRARIVNDDTSAEYYHGYSNSPFRPSPNSDTRVDSLAPGATAYLRYELAGHPTGVPCWATITLHTGEGLTGTSSVRAADFDLP